MSNFDVGKSGLVLSAIVDELFAAIDELVVPEFLEGAIDGVDDFLIKGESEAGPVTGGAKRANLQLHVAALLDNETPDLVIEVITGEIETGLPFRFEFAFIDDPGFEASMVCARNIPRVFAFHAMIAGEDVLECDGEAVANMKIAIGVWRRHDNSVRLFIFIVGWFKCARFFPECVYVWLVLIRLVGFAKFHGFIIA